MKTSKVDSAIIKAKTLIVKVLRLGNSDVQTSKQISNFGIDYRVKHLLRVKMLLSVILVKNTLQKLVKHVYTQLMPMVF